ncbi:MAG: DUF736 domain-containing protein [Acidiphilium sp.]|nr:DUF736 domain-containing protein [Acidiphilium sp.]
MLIGTFKLLENGKYKGQLRTLTVDARVDIVPVDQKSANGPDYRLFAGIAEIGAAWRKTSEKSGREYLWLKLDDPSFPKEIWASLIEQESGDGYALIWGRRD